MNLINGQDIKGRYYKFGPGGKKYYYKAGHSASRTRAKNKAMKQGRAMAISKKL